MAIAEDIKQISGQLPDFSNIDVSTIEKQLEQHLTDNRAAISAHLAAIAEDKPDVTYANYVEPLERLDNTLALFWSPIRHLNSVASSPKLRQAHDRCQLKLAEYYAELGQNQAIFSCYQQLEQAADVELTEPEQQAVKHALRDFKLAGVDLPEEKQQTYRKLKEKLSQLSSAFSNNVLDATDTWHHDINDEAELAGLSDTDKAMLAAKAKSAGVDGWRLGLDFPSYYAVITFADSRKLRETVYQAYVTRASDQGPQAGKYDNSAIMSEIIGLKTELAALLDYGNYTEYSLATKMAAAPDEVLNFLYDLRDRVRPQAAAEFSELTEFARSCAHALPESESVEPWDVSYYSNKLKEEKYSFSEDQMKPYLSLDRVIEGMFDVVKRLYGIDIEPLQGLDVWNPEVRVYALRKDGRLLAIFYGDFMAREHKRSGAWMDDHCGRAQFADSDQQIPVAYLTCNFTPATADKPSLLTMAEVTTLFHEFGHGLHHMLTEIDVLAVSGINGVPWDAVELPSQFMENWCWSEEALALFAYHLEDNLPVPDHLLEKALRAKNFHSALMINRQLEFALFDFKLHNQGMVVCSASAIGELLQQVRDEVSVVPSVPYNRFQHSFSHIFAGGYAAGYYSYLWAEVLACDAFARFEDEGIFNQSTGHDFLSSILSQGGSREFMDLFENFRGRKPELDAFLKANALA